MLFHRHRPPRWLQGLIKRRVVKKLGLNVSQAQQLDELHLAMQQTHNEMHRVHVDARQQLRTILQGDDVKQGQVTSLLSIPGKFIEDQAPQLAETLARFLSGLNSEQRLNLERFIQRRTHRHCA